MTHADVFWLGLLFGAVAASVLHQLMLANSIDHLRKCNEALALEVAKSCTTEIIATHAKALDRSLGAAHRRWRRRQRQGGGRGQDDHGRTRARARLPASQPPRRDAGGHAR